MPTVFIFLSIYGGLAVVVAIAAAAHDARERREDDIIASGVSGLLCGVLWLLLLVVLPLGWVGTRISRFSG